MLKQKKEKLIKNYHYIWIPMEIKLIGVIRFQKLIIPIKNIEF